MVALFVIVTFLAAVLIDHLLNRQPILATAAEPKESPARPRLVPAFVAGFELPENLRYHPGHTWAVAETPELVRVGIDDFAAKVSGKVSRIDVPQRGQWIRQGQKIIALHHDGREIDLVSPIEGAVVDINMNAIDHPELAHDDPYGEGWLVKVNSPDSATNFRNLLGGTTARRWLDDAAARLRALAMPGAIAYAQDGGVASTSMIDQLPDAEWTKVTRELFL